MYNKIENFYNEYLKLHDIKRTGWIIRNIPDEKIETVADHSLQVTVLATTLCHEFNLDFDLAKVSQMCFIHDVGEIIIGDVAVVDKNYEKKKEKEYEAVAKVLETLSEKTANLYLSLWKELDERESDLAKFVYQVDKLDAIMRAKKYAKEYNRPELFDEFYNHQVEAKTFDDSPINEFFDNIAND